MDPRFMGKSVGAHDRLVGLHHHAREVGNQAGGFGDLLSTHRRQWSRRISITTQEGIEVAAAHMQRHHQFLKGSITGSLTNAVDRAFELSRTVLDSLQEVGNSKAEIVVSMNRQHRIADIGNMAINSRDQLTKLRGCGVTDRIGNVDGGGASSNRSLDDFVEKFWVAASCVFAGELDVIDQGMGIRHHVWNDGQHLLTAFAQFVFEVNIAGCDESMDPSSRGWSNRFRASFDVAS